MARPNLNKAEFIKSAAAPDQFVQSAMSSVINRLLNRKNFARVGSEPGKTIHVNYFLIDAKAYFIDLPGYGFAKVSRSEKERWAKLMESFFAGKDLYDRGVLIVDARHKPTADDVTMAAYFKSSGADFIVVANKLDKLKKSEIEEKGQGREELLQAIFPE